MRGVTDSSDVFVEAEIFGRVSFIEIGRGGMHVEGGLYLWSAFE